MRKVAAILFLASVASSAFAGEGGPEQTVRQLYKSFAWEAVMSEPSTSLEDQPQAVLQLYFTPKLAAALRADGLCSIRTKSVCALDFSPIWNSQDPGAYDLKVSRLGQDRVLVEFKTPPAGEPIRLDYRLVKQGQGWRISDIRYSDGSSLQALLAHGQ